MSRTADFRIKASLEEMNKFITEMETELNIPHISEASVEESAKDVGAIAVSNSSKDWRAEHAERMSAPKPITVAFYQSPLNPFK